METKYEIGDVVLFVVAGVANDIGVITDSFTNEYGDKCYTLRDVFGDFGFTEEYFVVSKVQDGDFESVGASVEEIEELFRYRMKVIDKSKLP